MDPIVDMLNRIRNAQAVLKPTVEVPFSNLKYKIAQILEKQEFVERVNKRGRSIRKKIEIILKYDNKTPAISGLKRISKQGQRIYMSKEKIQKEKHGFGVFIISSSKGLITDQEAREKKIGGEIICKVW